MATNTNGIKRPKPESPGEVANGEKQAQTENQAKKLKTAPHAATKPIEKPAAQLHAKPQKQPAPKIDIAHSVLKEIEDDEEESGEESNESDSSSSSDSDSDSDQAHGNEHVPQITEPVEQPVAQKKKKSEEIIGTPEPIRVVIDNAVKFIRIVFLKLGPKMPYLIMKDLYKITSINNSHTKEFEDKKKSIVVDFKKGVALDIKSALYMLMKHNGKGIQNVKEAIFLRFPELIEESKKCLEEIELEKAKKKPKTSTTTKPSNQRVVHASEAAYATEPISPNDIKKRLLLDMLDSTWRLIPDDLKQAFYANLLNIFSKESLKR
jgi:hypothetical protein